MKSCSLALLVILTLAAVARAQDDTTAKPQTPPDQTAPASSGSEQAPQPAAPPPQAGPAATAQPPAPAAASPAAPETSVPKQTPKEQAVKQEAPRETPETAAAKAQEPAAPTPAPKAAAQPQTACALALVPLADSYRQAYQVMLKFVDDVDAQAQAADDRVAKLEKQIETDEAALTKAELDGDSAKQDDLKQQDKQLWKDLKAAKKDRDDLCASFARDARQKVHDLTADAEAKLAGCQQRMQAR